MSRMLDEMAAAAIAETAEVSSAAFDKALSATRERLGSADPGRAHVAIASAALDTIETHKADLIHLGAGGLTSVLAYAASGLENDAVSLLLLREKASIDDLINASLESTEEVLKENALTVVKAITVNGARAVLPFLLGVL